MNTVISKVIYVFVFLLSLFLVVKGNTINGYNGLIMMLVGLGGLLIELYSYNKKYQ